MLTFVLLNDSETPLDVESGSWRIVINGSERNDSGMLFGNGPVPEGGYTILKPGESYEFGKALPIAEYFLPHGQYKGELEGGSVPKPHYQRYDNSGRTLVARRLAKYLDYTHLPYGSPSAV
jgi:hypothetical protein